jgi:hypothetical protein
MALLVTSMRSSSATAHRSADAIWYVATRIRHLLDDDGHLPDRCVSLKTGCGHPRAHLSNVAAQIDSLPAGCGSLPRRCDHRASQFRRLANDIM